MEVFGADWARAWMVEVNADPSYREAGRGWHGAIVVRMWEERDVRGRSLYVDLEDGECRAARVASDSDTRSAPYVIGAPLETWRSVLEGGIDPIVGLLQGKLKLERGNLLKLVPYARAAKVLLAAAGRVPARFPGLSPVMAEDGYGAGDAEVAGGNGGPHVRGTGTGGISHGAPVRAGMGEAGDGGTAPAIAAPVPGAGGEGALSRRLDRSLVPMKLWQSTKRQGTWDPREIDLKKDREDWNRLTAAERDLLIRLAVQFRGGEWAASVHLLPLMSVIAGEGRVEDAMYLSSYLMEEAKHIELFDRFLDEVARTQPADGGYETTAWQRMFGEILPAELQALRTDASPLAQVRAAVTFHLVIEGILGETGYQAYHLILERRGILPGMQRAMQYIKRDETRHMMWGHYLVGRLVAEHGDLVWKLAESRLAELLEPSLDVVRDVFAAYDAMPFDLRQDTFTAYATSAFRSRLSKLEASRHVKLHEFIRAAID